MFMEVRSEHNKKIYNLTVVTPLGVIKLCYLQLWPSKL